MDKKISLTKSEKIASRIIEGQAFIVTPLNSTLHIINEVGTRIWQLIEEKKSVQGIIETICEEYEIDQATAKRDTLEFIDSMKKKNILE